MTQAPPSIAPPSTLDRLHRFSETLGGETGLAQFREKLATHGIKLLLDFVPNHTAPTIRG